MKLQIVLTVVCITRVTFTQHIYHALSSDWPVTKCPVNTCYNLIELLNGDILGDRVSNVTLLLLPGMHVITRSKNTVFNITSSTNFVIKGENSTQRAIIMCNGSVSFKFDSCVNLTISDITIENCGGHILPHKKISSIYISHSLGVYVTHINLLNGTGVGLLLENVQHQFILSESVLSHNDHNLYISSHDNSRVKSILSKIRIFNSSFRFQKKYSGISLHMYQTYFLTEVIFNSINIINAKSKGMQVELNMCTYIFKLYNIRSITNISKEQNLYIRLRDSTKCIHQTNVIIENVNYTGGEIHILGRKINRYPAMISIKNTNISQCTISITNIVSTLTNVIIYKTASQKRMLVYNCSLNVVGYLFYQQNQGSLVLEKSNVTFETYSSMQFKDNSNTHESPLYSRESNLKMMSATSMIFENNIGYQSGGITLEKSLITFEGNTVSLFINNTGKRGGAMAFYNLSQLVFIEGKSNLTFISNHATVAGGAIYIHDYDYVTKITHSNVLFHEFLKVLSKHNTNITFINNTATQAGSALYGGLGNKNMFSRSFDNSKKNNFSMGTTTPFKVCVCTDSVPNCTIPSPLDYHIIPGKPFKINVVAVGQWDGVVPASIQIYIRKPSQAKVKPNEYIQSTGRNCTDLHYTFTHLKQHDTFYLQIITTDRVYVAQHRFSIKFFLLNCSLGFSFSNESKICICNKVLVDHNIECDIETLTIKRPSPKWINATVDHLLVSGQSGVIVHNHCPYDYCLLPINNRVQQLDLNYPDQQCAFRHSGILCGGCEANFSQVLGTSKCRVCSNSRLPLLLFLVALAGVALVASLILLNITVSAGTINGLIFYANILRANAAFFFPQLVSTSFLSTFIAWLNLDLGIETCLYNGLDAYFKTWFQFLFPLYIWLIVIAIVVIARHSIIASKLVGWNSVQVLATLFLISYAKLLRTIITIFSSTVLTYPDGYVRRVWLYDGNVNFLSGKHILLFTVALIFLVLVSIPLTATLMCIQWLQKISHYKLFFWVAKLQPLFDAYTGPYKTKHRYWTGLLLLVRVCFFLIFSLNTLGDPVINLLTIVACMFGLFAYLSIIGGVYKLWWINLIETSFIMNLGLLSAAGLYKVAANVDITPITYTSTGITFVLFIAIFSYHLAAKVSQTKCGQVFIGFTNRLYQSLQERRKEIDTEENCFTDTNISDNIVTYSEVELTEPLLVTN